MPSPKFWLNDEEFRELEAEIWMIIDGVDEDFTSYIDCYMCNHGGI